MVTIAQCQTYVKGKKQKLCRITVNSFGFICDKCPTQRWASVPAPCHPHLRRRSAYKQSWRAADLDR